MKKKKSVYIKGTLTQRPTETDYMGVLLDAVSLPEWREVVSAALAAAKSGDATARAWLSQYLVGRPSANAPAPLTVVVQQLSGNDVVIESIAKPHITQDIDLIFNDETERKSLVESLVADELRELRAASVESK